MITPATPAADPPAAGRQDEPWHTRDAGDVERALSTGPDGLAAVEAARRLDEYGPNVMEVTAPDPWWMVVLRQLRDPLIYILLVAAGLTLALRDYADASVILLVVALNTIIGYVQERRAQQAMQALARLSTPRATVVRDGEHREIESRLLVPGDVVLLTAGARVPADLRLVQARDLSIDESLLTGESVTAQKSTDPLAATTLVASDQTNMSFAGTAVVRGRGRGVVVRTAATTELGRIAESMRAVVRPKTPLQDTLEQFGRRVGIVVVGLALLALAFGLARGIPVTEIFLAAVALAVSGIPEGLPVALTVALAVGLGRMAKRNAIIRSLPAVETLGSVTVIGTDKTGTLTRNEMTVRALWAAGARYDVSGVGYATTGEIEREGQPVTAAAVPPLRALLESAVLANEADAAAVEAGAPTGDPTEIALCVVAAKAGLAPAALQQRHPELDLLPFESERRFMVSLRASADGATEHLKGAPEVVLARCDRQAGDGGAVPLDQAAVLDAAADLASRGLRVLATASRPAPAATIDVQRLDSGFVLGGLVGMDDPIRPEAAAAIASAHTAGIRVLMLTGDHIGTARAVGARLGLGDAGLEGSAIGTMSDAELDDALQRVHIYARVAPEHKLRIVQRLKAHDEVVAMTGDGVNDAPALRAAHIGVAMGASGTDVAREAADMVLGDDDFATITGAIEEGRIVFANIRKVTFFLLSTAVGEVLAIVVALAAGWPLPFVAAQILWINLVTNGLQDVALAFEPGEPGLLRRAPRPRTEGILSRRLFIRLLGVGMVLLAATLAVFWWTLTTTGDLVLARSVAVSQMVVMQVYHVFNCRSLERSILSIPLTSNRFLFISVVAAVAAHIAAMYIPLTQRVLQLTPLSAQQWGVILVVGLVVVVGGELDKFVNRRHGHGVD